MVLIWRGVGILVPIIFVACGFLVRLFVKDDHLGNPVFLAWTCLAAAVICLPLGLMTWKGSIKEKVDIAGNVRRIRKRHDFFYIPIIFWALIMGAGSVIAFTQTGKSRNTTTSAVTTPEEIEKEIPLRTINLYNPTADTLEYYIGDDEGIFSSVIIEPWATQYMEMSKESYFFGAYNRSTRNAVLAIPAAKMTGDKEKSVASPGTEYTHRRILPPATPDTSDYDELWIMLDAEYGMAILDVTDVYEKPLRSIRWKEKILTTYAPQEDIIAPVIKTPAGENHVEVIPPNTYLPAPEEKKGRVYILLPYTDMSDLTEKNIISEVERLIRE